MALYQIDFVYQINDFETKDILINSGFTVVYPYISNEHYEGEVPTSKEQQVSETEPSPMSASTPALSLASSISILTLVFILLRR